MIISMIMMSKIMIMYDDVNDDDDVHDDNDVIDQDFNDDFNEVHAKIMIMMSMIFMVVIGIAPITQLHNKKSNI